MEDMQMPAHIQAHSLMVCRVALVLADALISAGLTLDRELIRAAAVLHDITKPRSFKTGEYHAQTGGEYLTELGFYEVGEIIRQHVILDVYPENQPPCEAEVVNYADKRVLHDRIVPLDQRMEYIHDHYAKTDAHRELLMVLWQQTQMLENRLFQYLNFTPENLAEHSGNHTVESVRARPGKP
jgi:putative nucleotidyltransferase with HDIG domain